MLEGRDWKYACQASTKSNIGSVNVMKTFLGAGVIERAEQRQERQAKEAAEEKRVAAEKKRIAEELADEELLDEKDELDKAIAQAKHLKDKYKKSKDNVKAR